MAIFTRDGYGVVEPNHLSAPRTGQVYAQLPAAEGIDILENGMFVRYNYGKKNGASIDGEVSFEGEGPWMLVFNEEKLYDERHQMHKHFAQKVEDSYDGKIYPRCLVPVLGDVFTTNMFADEVMGQEMDDLFGKKFTPGEAGKLVLGEAAPCFKAVACYIMPDGQPGIKLQCIKEQ